jgi:hypothetical protein
MKTTWNRFRQAESNADPLENDRVLMMARQRQKDAGEPAGFAVVIDTEYDDATPQEAYRVYYFSPVASEVFKSALEVLGAKESDAPTTNRGPVVGDLLK